MENAKFTKTFTSEVYIVSSVIQELMGFLSKKIPSISKEDHYDLRLIYSELLFNAVIHGNNKDANKHVTLLVEILPSNVVVSSIEDEGKGFDYNNLLKECEEETSGENIFNESGRGIKLVSCLTDKLCFNSIGNQIKFYKRVKV